MLDRDRIIAALVGTFVGSSGVYLATPSQQPPESGRNHYELRQQIFHLSQQLKECTELLRIREGN